MLSRASVFSVHLYSRGSISPYMIELAHMGCCCCYCCYCLLFLCFLFSSSPRMFPKNFLPEFLGILPSCFCPRRDIHPTFTFFSFTFFPFWLTFFNRSPLFFVTFFLYRSFVSFYIFPFFLGWGGCVSFLEVRASSLVLQIFFFFLLYSYVCESSPILLCRLSNSRGDILFLIYIDTIPFSIDVILLSFSLPDKSMTFYRNTLSYVIFRGPASTINQ